MGGAFGTLGHGGNVTPVAEANVYCDPHAADVVFGAAWPVTVVGLDVTHQVLMSTAYLDALGHDGGAEGRYLRDITRPYERFYQPAHRRRHLCARCQRGGLRAGRRRASRCSTARCAWSPTGWRWARPCSRGAATAVRRSDWNGLPEQQVCVAVDAAGVLADFRACFVG